MKKKIRKTLFCSLITIAMSLLSFGLYGCNRESSNEIIHTIRNVGTFSGYRVDFVRIETLDADVAAVVRRYYVDDVYISTRPDPSYKYLVYTSEKDYVTLKNAYKQNLVTHDDLLSIAEAEKPYDRLYNEDATGPRVP